MSKAEEFIEKYTKDGTNQIINGTYGTIIPHFYPWLTPDEAKKAVEIAREEMIEWLKENADKYIVNTTPSYPDADFSATIGGVCWEDLKQAMKDE